MNDHQATKPPSHADGFKSDIKWVAEEAKKKGKSLAEALSKARTENARFEKELGESLPEQEWREVVQGVYGTAPRKLFLNTKLLTFTPIEQAVWLVRHVLLQGALNLFVGAPDIGKTLVAIYYIAKLTREGKRVVVICREDSYGMVWKPRLIAAKANLDLVLCVSGVKEDADGEEQPWFLDSDTHRNPPKANVKCRDTTSKSSGSQSSTVLLMGWFNLSSSLARFSLNVADRTSAHAIKAKQHL